MEGLKLRSYVFAGVLLLIAAFIFASPRPGKVAGRTEQWMEQVAPAKVASYTFEPDPQDPLCSYRSPQMVYDALAPTVGILARVYSGNGSKFDVQLIASRDRASFHDPRICFTAQGYQITDEQAITIHTETRGDIPATMAKMEGPDHTPMVAVYFYRGPRGFYGGTTEVKMALLMDQLKGRTDLDGVFYRFVLVDGTDADKLSRFIGLYMDKAGKDSKGYF